MKRRTRRFWKGAADRVEADNSHLSIDVTILSAPACNLGLFLESRLWWRILRRIDSASGGTAADHCQGIRRGQCGVEWNDNSDFQFVEPEHKPVFERDR